MTFYSLIPVIYLYNNIDDKTVKRQTTTENTENMIIKTESYRLSQN